MFLSLLVFTVRSSRASATGQLDIRASSLFRKLPIISVRQIGPRTVQVIFRNDYEKDITALIFSVGASKVIRRDYILAELEKDQRLSAGAADNLVNTVDPLSRDIVISGVLFSDGSREGDKSEITGLLEERRGMKMQFARFNPRFRSFDPVEPSTMMKELNEIKEFAASLPIATDDGSPMSDDVEHGLRTGQSLILKSLSKLEGDLRDEKIETFYSRDGTALVTTKEERVRKTFTAIEKDLKGLERRL